MLGFSAVWSLLEQNALNLGYAAVQVLPCALILPFLGLRALPAGVRSLVGLVLLCAVTPALLSTGAPTDLSAWFARAWSGVPLAVMSSAALWTATMTGNLLDDLRTHPDMPRSASETWREASPLGLLLSLAAAVGFFQLGGPSRIAAALQDTVSSPITGDHSLLQPAALAIVRALSVALAIASPLLAVRLVSALIEALIGRITRPSSAAAPVGALMSLAHLTLVALLLDRIVEHLAAVIDTSF